MVRLHKIHADFPFYFLILFNVFLDKLVPEPRHLPCLIVNTELTFFSSNAAVCYFLPPPENLSSKIYDWLEWEANTLCTALVSLGGSVKNDSIKNKVLSLLKFLDKELTNDHLVGVSGSF